MPECGPIRIEPEPGGSDSQAVYATFILKNTPDARVTQAGCLTTPSDVPYSYCYFEISATVPEPAVSLGIAIGVVAVALFHQDRRAKRRAIHGDDIR